MKTLRPPWSPAIVEQLNAYQRNPAFHPYTCGGKRGDPAHVEYAERHKQHDTGILVAALDGWRCPVCDYTQDWAHEHG